MTFNIVNLATISVTDKELQTLREASQFIEKLERVLEYRPHYSCGHERDD